MAVDQPQFINTDAAATLAAVIAQFETLADRTLLPAQAERLIVNMLAAREILLRQAIQYAASQNLVAFADFPALHFLGELVGVYQEPAKAAITTIRFTVSPEHGGTTIPSGTRIGTKDTRYTFLTDTDMTIPADQTFGDVIAVCDTEGTEGNGYEPGEVNLLLDPVGLVLEALNTDTTAGGAAEESKEKMRERIKLAPSGFSTAGSREGYRYHALASNPAICDVAVTNPAPGRVNLYLLTVTGLPDPAIVAGALAACSDEKVRPLTDTVNAYAATEIAHACTADLILYDWADQTDTLAAAIASVEAFIADSKAKLGRDVVPDQYKKALMVPGVYRVNLTAPAALVAVGPTEWANCNAVNITVGGVTNG